MRQLVGFDQRAAITRIVRTTPSCGVQEARSSPYFTRAKIGSRGIGHRLTQKERLLFEAAKKHGFLKTPASGIRSNVINVYRLWCAAEGRNFMARIGLRAEPRFAQVQPDTHSL